MNSWPDAAMTPFRSEKNSNWEGAYRVPAMVRWPGQIKPGSVSNEIVSHLDFLPTLLAIAGDTQVTEKLLKGYKVGDMTYKVYLDGYNLVPYLTGKADEEPAGLVLLRQRRPAADRPAVRQLQVRVHGAAGPGHDANLGANRSSRCASRRSSTSGPTRTSARTSRRTRTTTGFSITPSSFVPAQAVRRRSSSRRSRTTRSGRRPAVVQHGRGLREDEGVRRALSPADTTMERPAAATCRPRSR